MGYRINTYSITELNKLTSPGSVVPALFWAIPLGNWNYNDLDNLWRLFTDEGFNTKNRYSFCKTLGLLLVKNNFDTKNDIKANLSSITGKLEDLLPEGINTIYKQNEFDSDNNISNKFLVLTGNYPQPGWGLFVNATNYINFLNELELFLNEFYFETKQIFEKTQNDYHYWKKIKIAKPIKESAENSKRIIVLLDNIIPEINRFEAEVISKTYDIFRYEIINKHLREFSSEDINDIIKPFNEIFDDNIIFSMIIMRLLYKDGVSKNDLNSLIKSFSNEHDKQKNNLFKLDAIKNSTYKRLLGSHILKRKDKLNLDADCVLFYEQYYKQNITFVSQKYSELISKINSFYIKTKISIEDIEKTYDANTKNWIRKTENLRLIFQESIENILNQYNIHSYRFLYQLENRLRNRNYTVKSFSWDPPRMVGWKLLASGLEIENYNVTEYIKSKIPDFPKYLHESLNEIPIDGNSFTDYIHYYSIHKSNQTPRLACKEILSKILRSSEIRNILSNNSPTDISDDKIELVLNHFGWPSIENENIPLAAFIERNGEQLFLNSTFNPNKLRTSLENFCKDLIDILISKIGFDSEQIHNLIKYEIAIDSLYDNYKRKKNWHNFISSIELYGASQILARLLVKGYPTVNHKNLLDNINFVRNQTNQGSHDNPQFNIDKSKIAESILLILSATQDIISEMPWHFTPLQKNGILPYVLTGRAWSHSFPNEKQISVILWDSVNTSNELLIWNPDKKNPVMPNAKNILRPL